VSKKRNFSDKARNILSSADSQSKPTSMREFLEDNPDSPEQDRLGDGSPGYFTGSAGELPEANAPDPTERLHCFIPRSLKLRVEAYVLERKREKKKGEKIDITTVVIEALKEKLDRDGA